MGRRSLPSRLPAWWPSASCALPGKGRRCTRGSATASSASARGWTYTCLLGRVPGSPWATRSRLPARPWPSFPLLPAMTFPQPEPMPDEPQRRRSIYLLPNAFTTANLFAGFYAVVQAMNQHFEVAAIAVFLAMVFDSMDGRVARLTNTQSAFGEQHDSLADMMSFGMAPALALYEWSLQGPGRRLRLAVRGQPASPARRREPLGRVRSDGLGGRGDGVQRVLFQRPVVWTAPQRAVLGHAGGGGGLRLRFQRPAGGDGRPVRP